MSPDYPQQEEDALRQVLRTVLQNHLTRDRLSLNAALLAGVWTLGLVTVRFTHLLGLPLRPELDHVRAWLTYRMHHRKDVPPLVLSDEAGDDDDVAAVMAHAKDLDAALRQLIDDTAVERGIRCDVLLNVALGLMADLLWLLQDTLGWDLEEVEALIAGELHRDLLACTQADRHDHA
jgi:hypothetical protein